jgi:hypothetical protein
LLSDPHPLPTGLAGISGTLAATMMGALVQDGPGFGVLLVGRYRDQGELASTPFADQELRALVTFADAAAPLLRISVHLRRLARRLDSPQPVGAGSAIPPGPVPATRPSPHAVGR